MSFFTLSFRYELAFREDSKADEELNTPDVIDRNEFRARIGVQPTKAVEFMFIEFSIHRTGSFEAGSDTF